MKRRNRLKLTAAIAAMYPAMVHAAVYTISFDLNDIKISPTENGAYVSASAVAGASLTGNSSGPVLTIPSGYFAEYGLDATVTDNNGLGIASWQLGVTDGNPSVAGVVRPAQHVMVNPYFTSAFGPGTSDGSGGITTLTGTVGSFIAAGTSTPPVYGAGTPGELFKSMVIAPVAKGSDVFAVTANLPAFSSAVYVGLTSSGGAFYANKGFVPGVDTLSPLPALTINIGVPEPTGCGVIAGAGGTMLMKRKKRGAA